MSIVCEEIFDEASHPSVDEVRDYAIKIGIDPDSEPQLLPLASQGLMKALPAGWKPCYDDNLKKYYYYNQLTKKTQWEHPLDDIYRNLVRKARADQSWSINELTEDATYAKDDELKSYEESVPPGPPPKLQPLMLGAARKRDIKLSPLKLSPAHSPKHESKLLKQRSEDILVGSNKFLHKFSSFDEDNKDMGVFDRHPRALERLELKVTGGGAMFLKSNTRKNEQLLSLNLKSDGLDLPKSILRDRSFEHSKSMEFDKVSLNDKSDKDDDDKKSVRFNLDNNTTDVGITFSDKSSSEEDINISDKQLLQLDSTNAKAPAVKSRFSVTAVAEPVTSLKLIKVPMDFVKPKLTLSRGSDSDEDTKSIEKQEFKTVENLFDSESDSSPDDDLKGMMLEEKAEKKVAEIKQKLWEEKNEELINYKLKLEESHRHELDRILEEEKSRHEETTKTELCNLKVELEMRTKQERLNFEKNLEEISKEYKEKLAIEKDKIVKHFEGKREELEKYYDEKLVDIEKELADKVGKQKEEMLFNNNADVEQLKQNHSIIIEEIKREFKVEEQILRQQHQTEMTELKSKFQSEVEMAKSKSNIDERQFEKIRCEKRLLEDKYRCLKEKYLRLKTEVKLSLEKRNKRKEQNSTNTTATNTTGSETEQSHSNNKERTPLNSPSRKILDRPPAHIMPPVKESKLAKVVIQDLDTSISDNCYQSDEKTNQNDSSESTNPGRSRKKLFSRLKSSSTSKINVNAKSRKGQQRSCSPVENLRKQLQKLEDLEDQFPQNSQSDTYHLRYPFSDGQKFEGSSELEFFRHRIHLERDSIKRAKESLRSQKALFQQRQKELKLKHGSMARHTLQQLCQEEKELTDMEVNLHRTRSLLGEKVIRLRHLEQSLNRANAQSDPNQIQDDATLSDLSTHSASSGISSTEFAAADALTYAKAISKNDFQESSEIIQSLENLNLEIREIWDVLRTQQQQTSIAQVIPPLVYPDLGWPVLAGAANIPAPPSIPTLADRLHNYRQHVALANAQSTVVTQASQGATTTLIERTRNLRHWLRQTGIEAVTEPNPSQTTL